MKAAAEITRQLICPKCSAEGHLIQYMFSPWNYLPAYPLYKGTCPACGFEAHPAGSSKRAAEWFNTGTTENPLFDQWRQAAAKGAGK